MAKWNGQLVFQHRPKKRQHDKQKSSVIATRQGVSQLGILLYRGYP